MKVKLGDIAAFINGDRGKNYPSQADILETGEIPFVNAGHLTGREICFDEMNYISKEKYDCLNAGKFCKGDILYCLRGSLGKKALVKEDIDGAIASSLVIIRADEEQINRDYLMFALDSPSIKKQLIKANNGSSQPNLSASSVKQYDIDLPDKKAQETIVSRLIKVRNIVDARNNQLEKLDDLIKSRFVEMFGDPVINEHGYYVDTLQNLIDMGYITYHLDGNHGGEYPRSEEFVENGIPYIGANCISGSEIDFKLSKHLTLERASRLRKGIAQNEDVLFANNATVGPVVVLHTNEKKVILSTSLTAYRCNQNYLKPNYLKGYMLSEGFVNQYLKDMKQTTRNQVPITQQRKYQFMVPPIEEQIEFENFVNNIDKLKVKVQQSLNETQLMFDSLMQKYFG